MARRRVTVADTNVLIDILRGRESALAWLKTQPAPPVCSEMSRVEVLRGMRSGERPATERLLAEIDWMAVDARVGVRAGELGRAFRRSHPGLALADLVIGATAEVLEAELATRNVRHFPMFPDLRAPY